MSNPIYRAVCPSFFIGKVITGHASRGGGGLGVSTVPVSDSANEGLGR